MEPNKKPNGALVGLIVIVIILIAGGVYIWRSQIASMVNNLGSNPQTPVDIRNEPTPTDSDLNTLDKSLDKTDVNIGVDTVNNLQ